VKLPTGLLLKISAVLTLVALALMVWSMLDPTPLPVMIAMTVAQGLGTLAFGLYGFVILKDLRRYKRVDSDSSTSLEIPVVRDDSAGPPP